MTTGRINQVAFLVDAGAARRPWLARGQGRARTSTAIVRGRAMMLAWYVGKRGRGPKPTWFSASEATSMPAWSTSATRRPRGTRGTRGRLRGPVGASTRNESTRGTSALKAGMQHRDPNCVRATLETTLIESTPDSSMREHGACQAMQPFHHSHAITYARPQHHQTYPTTTRREACHAWGSIEWRRVCTAGREGQHY